jgi:hypothetical protein
VSSPFLKVPESEWVASNTLAFAIRDRYPVSPGHTLVMPRRPVATWFEATPEEQRALFALVDTVSRGLDLGHQTVGGRPSCGRAALAGCVPQTLPSVHSPAAPDIRPNRSSILAMLRQL